MLNLLWMLFKGFLRWKQKLIGWCQAQMNITFTYTVIHTKKRGWSACIFWLCDCLGIIKSHYVILKYFHLLFVPTKGCWNRIHVFLQAQLYAWGLHHKGFPGPASAGVFSIEEKKIVSLSPPTADLFLLPHFWSPLVSLCLIPCIRVLFPTL